jgi:hypothetical protein
MRPRRPHSDSQQRRLSNKGGYFEKCAPIQNTATANYTRSQPKELFCTRPLSKTQRQPTTHACNRGLILANAHPSTQQRQPTSHASNQGGCLRKRAPVENTATANNTCVHPGAVLTKPPSSAQRQPTTQAFKQGGSRSHFGSSHFGSRTGAQLAVSQAKFGCSCCDQWARSH